MICLNLSFRWSMHTIYTVHVKWPSGQQSIHVLSPLIVISCSEIQNLLFYLIAFLFFFLYCDIQTNDRHHGIMSKTDQYNNLFRHILVLICYYSTSLVSRCVYNKSLWKQKHTNLCWLAFSNKTIYSLSEGTSFCKRNKIVKFHFTNLSNLLYLSRLTVHVHSN